jgi:hypothetical protein
MNKSLKKQKFDFGLSMKYANDFIQDDKNYKLRSTIQAILKTEEKINKNIKKWNESDIETYLSGFKCISPPSMHLKLNTLRNFADYISTKTKRAKVCYDVEKFSAIKNSKFEDLLPVTLSYEQYKIIKEQLIAEEMGKTFNTRDKLMFELAWYGLSHTEIQMLKENDVKFFEGEYGEYVVLKLQNREIEIQENEVIKDIKNTMIEDIYISHTQGGTKRYKYKDTEYLLKPISVGAGKSSEYIAQPSLALQNVFKNISKPIICDGIDVEKLTLEHIRRSKIIYLLSMKDTKGYTVAKIKKIMNIHSTSNIYWLRHVVKLKYGNII